VKDCIQAGSPFGLVWTEGEPVVLNPSRPLVGTKAVMTEVTPLSDGRYNINTVGSERFLVRGLSYEHPYLTGHVEPFAPMDGDSAAARLHMTALLPLLDHYLALLSQAAEQEITLEETPDDPATLAFIVAKSRYSAWKIRSWKGCYLNDRAGVSRRSSAARWQCMG
jgi:Lon protease-like protein